MSDMTDTDFDDAAARAASIPPPPAPPPPAPPPPEPEPEPELPEPEVTDDGEKRYPSEVVEKLREENARRRIEARELREVWEGYSDEERERMQNVVRKLPEDPRAAYDDLNRMIENLREGLGIEEETDEMSEPEIDEDPQPVGERGLTEDDIAKLVDERLAAAAQESRAKQIFSDAQALDPRYAEGSDDLFQLLRVASREGSLEKADKVLKEREQGIRDEAVAEYRASLRGDHPPRVPATGSVTPKAEEVEDLDSAAKLAEEMMRAQFAMAQGETP